MPALILGVRTYGHVIKCNLHCRSSIRDIARGLLRVINTDQSQCYAPAIRESKEEGVLRKCCRHRPVQSLNNISSNKNRDCLRLTVKKGVQKDQGQRSTIHD